MPAPKNRVAGDFFGPFFKVKFYEPSAQAVLPASTGSDDEATIKIKDQQAQDKLDSLGIENYAANIELKFQPGSAQFTLTLTPPYDDAIKLLESSSIQFGGIVGVRWGYLNNDLTTNERLFTICQPSVSFGRDITFTLTGIDSVSWALRQRTVNSKYTRASYSTDLILLTRLATLCKFRLKEGTAQQFINSNHPVSLPKLTPIEQASSDWDLFIQLCKGNNLVYHQGEGNEITLQDRRAIVEPPTYNFLWYGQPKTTKDIPMMSFTTNPLPAIFSSTPEYVSKLVTHSDPDSMKTNFKIINPGTDPKNTTIGNPGTPNTVSGTADKNGQTVKTQGAVITAKPSMSDQGTVGQAHGKVASVPHNANNAVGKHESDSKDAALQNNSTATIIAPGHPDVIPPMNISVDGVSKLFNGNYYMITAKHSIGQRGYEMTLEVLKTTTAQGPNSQTNVKKVAGGAADKTSAPPTPSGPDDTSQPGQSVSGGTLV